MPAYIRLLESMFPTFRLLQAFDLRLMRRFANLTYQHVPVKRSTHVVMLVLCLFSRYPDNNSVLPCFEDSDQ